MHDYLSIKKTRRSGKDEDDFSDTRDYRCWNVEQINCWRSLAGQAMSVREGGIVNGLDQASGLSVVMGDKQYKEGKGETGARR